MGTHRHVELLQDHLLELPQALVHLWEGVNNLTAPPSDPGAIARGVGRRFGQSGRNPTRLGSLFDRQRLNWACEDAGVGAGSDDSPEEHRDLRVGPAHGALHVRDGNHDHHRAPPPSRDSSEPDCCCKNSAPHSWASRLMRRKGTAPVPGGVASPAERTLRSPARLPAGARGASSPSERPTGASPSARAGAIPPQFRHVWPDIPVGRPVDVQKSREH